MVIKDLLFLFLHKEERVFEVESNKENILENLSSSFNLKNDKKYQCLGNPCFKGRLYERWFYSTYNSINRDEGNTAFIMMYGSFIKRDNKDYLKVFVTAHSGFLYPVVFSFFLMIWGLFSIGITSLVIFFIGIILTRYLINLTIFNYYHLFFRLFSNFNGLKMANTTR